jgi:hypothetical protein
VSQAVAWAWSEAAYQALFPLAVEAGPDWEDSVQAQLQAAEADSDRAPEERVQDELRSVVSGMTAPADSADRLHYFELAALASAGWLVR